MAFSVISTDSAALPVNAGKKTAAQVIIEGDEYQVKFPIYDILNENKKKAGE